MIDHGSPTAPVSVLLNDYIKVLCTIENQEGDY